MNTVTYYLIALGFLLLSVALVALILKVLFLTLPYTGFTAVKQNRIFKGTMYTLIIWMVLMSALALSGIFADFTSMPPKMMIVIIPMLAGILGITLFSKTLGEILAHIPPSWLVHIQSFRIIVELLLWALFLQNMIPVQMTFEGRNFDVLTGLTAPFAAYYWFRAGRINKKMAIAWNIFGLILLVNIVTIAVLSLPTPFRVFMNEPANTIVATFPVVLLPGILVPIAYAMHFFSLKQLLSAKPRQR